MKNTKEKLPEELRTNYRRNRKVSSIVECLKVTAASKLWVDRGYRNVKFEVPLTCDGKTVFVKILAQDADGVVGVECASSLRMGRLCKRITQLRSCLPTDSWVVVVFPFGVDERARELVGVADEVWVTGKDGGVERMMFASVLRRGSA